MNGPGSLSELGQGGYDGRDSVVRVHEWWAVSRSPRELRGEAHGDRVLHKILGCEVSNLLLLGVVLRNLGEELSHLHSSDLSDISDIVQSLELVEVHHVVSGPEGEVVLHGNVKFLHVGGPGSALLDCTVDHELGVHEVLVLLSNPVDNIRGMDASLVILPVNGLKVIFSISLKVVEIKDGLELGLLVLSLIGVSSDSKSSEPLRSEVII